MVLILMGSKIRCVGMGNKNCRDLLTVVLRFFLHGAHGLGLVGNYDTLPGSALSAYELYEGLKRAMDYWTHVVEAFILRGPCQSG